MARDFVGKALNGLMDESSRFGCDFDCRSGDVMHALDVALRRLAEHHWFLCRCRFGNVQVCRAGHASCYDIGPIHNTTSIVVSIQEGKR